MHAPACPAVPGEAIAPGEDQVADDFEICLLA